MAEADAENNGTGESGLTQTQLALFDSSIDCLDPLWLKKLIDDESNPHRRLEFFLFTVLPHIAFSIDTHHPFGLEDLLEELKFGWIELEKDEWAESFKKPSCDIEQAVKEFSEEPVKHIRSLRGSLIVKYATMKILGVSTRVLSSCGSGCLFLKQLPSEYGGKNLLCLKNSVKMITSLFPRMRSVPLGSIIGSGGY